MVPKISWPKLHKDLLIPLLLSAASSQLPDSMGWIHMRKTYFYTSESGGQTFCVFKNTLWSPVLLFNVIKNVNFLSIDSASLHIYVGSNVLNLKVWSVKLLLMTRSEFSLINSAQCAFFQQYEVKRNWIFVPSATASSSDHNKETKEKPPKTSKVATQKTRGKRITSRI